MENNIDKEKIFLDNIGNRMKLAKENGCKLLDCKTIDNNIKLRLENIKLKSELEKYKRIAEVNLKDAEDYKQNMCEHRCLVKSHYEEELEEQDKLNHILQSRLDKADAEKIEWEKIAEKLAEELRRRSIFYNIDGTFDFCDLFIEDYEKCSKHNNGANCEQCIIDWARKEVEKNEEK